MNRFDLKSPNPPVSTSDHSNMVFLFLSRRRAHLTPCDAVARGHRHFRMFSRAQNPALNASKGDVYVYVERPVLAGMNGARELRNAQE